MSLGSFVGRLGALLCGIGLWACSSEAPANADASEPSPAVERAPAEMPPMPGMPEMDAMGEMEAMAESPQPPTTDTTGGDEAGEEPDMGGYEPPPAPKCASIEERRLRLLAAVASHVKAQDGAPAEAGDLLIQHVGSPAFVLWNYRASSSDTRLRFSAYALGEEQHARLALLAAEQQLEIKPLEDPSERPIYYDLPLSQDGQAAMVEFERAFALVFELDPEFDFSLEGL